MGSRQSGLTHNETGWMVKIICNMFTLCTTSHSPPTVTVFKSIRCPVHIDKVILMWPLHFNHFKIISNVLKIFFFFLFRGFPVVLYNFCVAERHVSCPVSPVTAQETFATEKKGKCQPSRTFIQAILRMLSENKRVFFLWSVELNLIITGGAEKLWENATKRNHGIKRQQQRETQGQKTKKPSLLTCCKIVCTGSNIQT